MLVLAFYVIIFASSVSGLGNLLFWGGNEHEQFEKYALLTKEVDTSDLYERFRQCESSVIPAKGFRSYQCRHDIRSHLQSTRKHVWKHEVVAETENKEHINNRYALDCSYEMSDEATYSVETAVFSYKIFQKNCKTDVGELGGTTFDVYAWNTEAIGYCRVIDHFDNIYSVDCKFPQLSDPSYATAELCMNISARVHYEHYDAFSDLGEFDWASMDTPVLSKAPSSGVICANIGKQKLPDAVELFKLNEKFWMRPGIHFKSEGAQSLPPSANEDVSREEKPLHKRVGRMRHRVARSSHMHLSTEYPDSNDYQWGAGRNGYLKISAMKRCLKRKTVFFIGESHMRYQFDITMDRYIDRLRVGRYHGAMNISGISYTDMTFSARLVPFLDAIQVFVHKHIY
jgi:hypothetical protein